MTKVTLSVLNVNGEKDTYKGIYYQTDESPWLYIELHFDVIIWSKLGR